MSQEKLLKGDRKLKEEVLNFFEELIEFWRDEENIGFIDGEKGKPQGFQSIFGRLKSE